MRSDGQITVYIIRHVHPHTITKGWDGVSWAGSGDCSQFERKERVPELYWPISASGDIWQKYGIHASEYENIVMLAAMDMKKNFPEYHWGVAKVELSQKTTEVVTFFAQSKGTSNE
jgi:hypothetical protein